MLALHTNTTNSSYYTACTRNIKPNQLNMRFADKYKARLLGNAWGICGTRCTPTNHSTAAIAKYTIDKTIHLFEST